MLTVEPNILDVTLLEPRQKHPTIFLRFDELTHGEGLTIHNDHDPKPLYYQLLGERGNIFNWEYLEEGPEWWKVRITKKIAGEDEETLGAMATRDLRKAQVFKKYGLDFCCGGRKTLKQACSEKGIDLTRIEKELQHVERQPAGQQLPYNEWGLDFLADYIVNTHHYYVKKNLPDISAYTQKVLKVHGAQHPELNKIAELVEELNVEMTTHMIKEEKVLFPYIKKLVNPAANQLDFAGSFGTVLDPINMMEMEHEVVGENMAQIRTLTNNYLLPADACTSYSLLYRLLEEFEEDLHLHVHLENNILFPKAIETEKRLTA